MDSKTTVEELKNSIGAFCKAREWEQFHNPRDLALHMTVEAAELLDHFRYKKDEELSAVMEKKRGEIEEELADVLILVSEFARMNNIDLSDVFMKKMAKNEKKYPLEKSKGNHSKYNEI